MSRLKKCKKQQVNISKQREKRFSLDQATKNDVTNRQNNVDHFLPDSPLASSDKEVLSDGKEGMGAISLQAAKVNIKTSSPSDRFGPTKTKNYGIEWN